MASSTDPADKANTVKAGYWFSASGHSVHQIDRDLFTHLYAGFAVVNKVPAYDNKNKVISFPPDNENIFKRFPEICQPENTRDHKVKAFLSIGGPDSGVTPKISEAIAYQISDPNRRRKFIEESIDLARKYKYDGLDLCWLYPSNEYPNQKVDLASFLNDWSLAVDRNTDGPKLLLTAKVFHHPVIPGADGKAAFSYPIEDLSRNMDRINILAVDFYTPSNSPTKTGQVHAWLNRHDKETDKCGSDGIDRWTESGKIETTKLVLSLPFYGYEWTLENPAEQYGFFAPAKPASMLPIEYSKIKANYLETNEGTHVYSEEYVAAYWYSGATWIGFDDESCIRTKIQSAVSDKNLGGYFAWHVTADDRNHTLSNAAFNALPPVN